MMQDQQQTQDYANDRETYDSIRSEQDENYTKNSIILPQLPQEFAKIQEIYLKSKQTVRSLAISVDELENSIANMQKNMSDCTNQEHFQDLLEEEEETSEFMVNYQEKCKKRQIQIKNLSDTYLKLKRLYCEETIFNFDKIHSLILGHTEKRKTIISITSQKSKLIILSKEITCIQTGECYFKLRILYTSKLIHRLSEQIEHTKQQAEKQVSISTATKIYHQDNLVKLAYHQTLQLFFVITSAAKILMLDMEGKQLAEYPVIDKNDVVVLLQVRQETLWIGTSSGILRVYAISELNLKLVKVYSCFSKEGSVNAYLLVGQERISKIFFSSSRCLFQLNLNSFEIQEILRCQSQIISFLDNYAIDKGNIHNIFVRNEVLSLQKNERLSEWYRQFHSTSTKQIVHIALIGSTLKVIVAQPSGLLQMINL